ncbi:AAA family ATPase [Staphylococcus xylosus]|uniref:AAA family ATPase n=1 Tax=Staphylococcus xylosus TaxID=1288 RepID=UPI003F551CCE
MAIVDKETQRFDEVTKADRLGLINALIHASAFEKFNPTMKKINRSLNNSEKFLLRLLPTLELYRKEGRLTSFGKSYEDGLTLLTDNNITEDTLKNHLKKLGSLKTPGGEMGIWTDSSYTLSPLAQKVKDGDITTKRYISIVFLNLFSFFRNDTTGDLEYKHFLFELLTFIKKNGVDKSYNKDILIDIFGFSGEKPNKDGKPVKMNNQKNILAEYLISTEFFNFKKVDNKDCLQLDPFCQNNIDQLLAICNLEYQNSSIEEVKSKLNRDNENSKKAYSEYLSTNANFLGMFYSNKSLIPSNKAISYNSAKLSEGSHGINRIYFGAPGTGKSFNIKNFIKKNGIENYTDKKDHPNVFRTTLHPEFSYSDFVGQVMPVVDGDDIKYDFVPNIFTRSLEKAFSPGVYNEQPVFLVLEEMSRANVAAVFGDIFQLLDRDDYGESEYKISNPLISKAVFKDPNKKIYIPSNLFIVGTVNTNDQNVYVMDTAFKRRFEFEYIPTNISSEQSNINNYQFSFENGNIKFYWSTFVNALNEYIVTPTENGGLGLSEDKQIGQFFIKFKNQRDNELHINSEINDYNFKQFTNKLLQYLWDDVEQISFTDNKIFSSEISHFGELYLNASSKKNIFSGEFLERIKIEK